MEEAKIQEADAGEEDSPEPEESAAGENEGEDSAPGGQSGRVVVHVCGQVAAPGVYELAEGSRIYEAIEAAGGVNGQGCSGGAEPGGLCGRRPTDLCAFGPGTSG